MAYSVMAYPPVSGHNRTRHHETGWEGCEAVVRSVSIVGVGSTVFGKQRDRSAVSLAVVACREALADADVSRERIEQFYLGNALAEVLEGQGGLAAMVRQDLGLGAIPCTRVEGACASAGIALRHGFLAIAHGVAELVLVAGVEKMSSAPTPAVTAALGCYADFERDRRSGLTFPGFYGLVARRHQHQYGTTRDQLSAVTVKNHIHGGPNPRAYLREQVTAEEVATSRLICDPLRLYDCSPISDGAAAAVLCATEAARDHGGRPVPILACAQTSGPTHIGVLRDLTTFPATIEAAQQAYRTAGIGARDVDVAEVHDCFSIAEIVDSEDLGFFAKGEGGPAAESGATSGGGEVTINPSGGLLSRGHPVGATGLAQIHELTLQLRGCAASQVAGARIGLAHNLGGTGAVATVTILGTPSR